MPPLCRPRESQADTLCTRDAGTQSYQHLVLRSPVLDAGDTVVHQQDMPLPDKARVGTKKEQEPTQMKDLGPSWRS